ncbi:MAG: HlyD family efflux transporter periplasmic adaptor subunit, partial [Bacteroidota bacterium]
LLPDLRLDYADVFPKWQNYIQSFDMEKNVAPLPEFDTEQEKLFILGKGIQTAYFNVKNMEERLAKYRIRAPFSGILTEALVDRGTLVRAGQKLGEFINPNIYELEVSINNSYADLMKVGKNVEVQNVEKTDSWTGKVTRVNSKVDAASQMISIFIQVSGQGLREGMYLEAEVKAKEEQNTYEIDRKLLVNNQQVFAVKDTTLQLIAVNPIYYKEGSVVIRGLEDGEIILAKAVPGAYEGMRVQVFGAQKEEEIMNNNQAASL